MHLPLVQAVTFIQGSATTVSWNVPDRSSYHEGLQDKVDIRVLQEVVLSHPSLSIELFIQEACQPSQHLLRLCRNKIISPHLTAKSYLHINEEYKAAHIRLLLDVLQPTRLSISGNRLAYPLDQILSDDLKGIHLEIILPSYSVAEYQDAFSRLMSNIRDEQLQSFKLCMVYYELDEWLPLLSNHRQSLPSIINIELTHVDDDDEEEPSAEEAQKECIDLVQKFNEAHANALHGEDSLKLELKFEHIDS